MGKAVSTHSDLKSNTGPCCQILCSRDRRTTFQPKTRTSSTLLTSRTGLRDQKGNRIAVTSITTTTITLQYIEAERKILSSFVYSFFYVHSKSATIIIDVRVLSEDLS